MGYRSKKSEVVHLVVENLKKKKNLPFKILTHKCISHKKNCRKHHGEIVVSSYNRKKKKFRLKYYSMHKRGIQFQYDQPAEFVEALIHDYLQSRKRIMDLKYLTKVLDKSLLKPRRNILYVRYNDDEYKIVKKKALQKDLSLSSYIRIKSIR